MTCVPDAGLMAFSSGPGELPSSKNTSYKIWIII